MTRLFVLLIALLLVPPLQMQAQEMSLSTESDDALRHFEEGRMAMGNVQFAKAQAHFDEAIAADPDFAVAYLYRAFASPLSERPEYVDKAKGLSADLSEGEQMMIDAAAASLDGQQEREIELLTKLTEQYPDDAWPSFQLGWTYYQQEDYDAARSAVAGALEADPEFAPAYNMIGYIHLAQDDHSGAEEAFKKYVAMAPEEANPYDSLGELYLNMDRYEEAAQQFEMALERDPEFAVSRDNLAWAQIAQANARFEEAFARQDAAAVAELYTSSAMMMPHGAETVQGRDAIHEYWRAAFARGVDGVELTTKEVRSMGDAAFEYGIAVPHAGGEATDATRYAVLWQRVGDEWKLHRDMWNSSTAPPPTTAVSN